MMKTQGRCF
jgi:hypothetical protein